MDLAAQLDQERVNAHGRARCRVQTNKSRHPGRQRRRGMLTPVNLRTSGHRGSRKMAGRQGSTRGRSFGRRRWLGEAGETRAAHEVEEVEAAIGGLGGSSRSRRGRRGLDVGLRQGWGGPAREEQRMEGRLGTDPWRRQGAPWRLLLCQSPGRGRQSTAKRPGTGRLGAGKDLNTGIRRSGDLAEAGRIWSSLWQLEAPAWEETQRGHGAADGWVRRCCGELLSRMEQWVDLAAGAPARNLAGRRILQGRGLGNPGVGEANWRPARMVPGVPVTESGRVRDGEGEMEGEENMR